MLCRRIGVKFFQVVVRGMGISNSVDEVLGKDVVQPAAAIWICLGGQLPRRNESHILLVRVSIWLL